MTTECRELESLLVELLDGRLTPAAEQRMRAHAQSCDACRASLSRWQHATAALRRLAPEPLTPLTLRRMELAIRQGVQAGAPASAGSPTRRWHAWRWAVMGAAAICVLGVLGTVLLRGRGPAPVYGRIDEVSGQVLLGDRSMVRGMSLQPGTSLVLAAGSSSLSLGRQIHVQLRGPSRLTFLGDERAVRVGLQGGELSAAVGPRRPDESFTVETRFGRVEVRGTRFTVGFAGEGAWVRVEEGRVAAFRVDMAEPHAVGAGQTLWLAPEVGSPPPPATGEQPAPLATETKASPAVAGCETATARARAAMRAGQPDRALRLLDQGPAAGSQRCRDELGYLRAEALRTSGRLREAIAAYLRLDRRGAEPAMRQNALFAAGELEERRGRHHAAYLRFEDALAAAPSGGLREEAMARAMMAARAARDEASAAAAARRYLREYPAGSSAARARQLLHGTTLLR